MKKKSILIICPFPEKLAAGQRLKYEQYFDFWIDNGYNVTVSPFMNVSMWNIVYLKGNYLKKIMYTILGHFVRLSDIFRIHRYDVVYVFMWVTPLGTIIFERIFRSLSTRLVYDIEDSTTEVIDNDTNSIVSFLKNANKSKFLMEVADQVITSSPLLNNYCLGINKKRQCKYISSSVNTDNFIPANNYNNNAVVTIGWTGTFSSKKYLDLLRSVFIELKDKCEFKLIIIGNFEYNFPEIDLEVIQWSSETEVLDMQKIDIGVYPLSDDLWVNGKSGLKAIQYMAFGLPIVASNVGITPKVINHMENGILVNNRKEWVDMLYKLIMDPALRKKIGVNGRNTAIEKYSNDVVGVEYLSILNNLNKE
jgi:glycosyltransferase involved in cell wall biosynthesis